MASMVKNYVEGLPDYTLDHGVVCWSLGDEHFCMSLASFRAWAEHARQFLAEVDAATNEPIPIRKLAG